MYPTTFDGPNEWLREVCVTLGYPSPSTSLGPLAPLVLDVFAKNGNTVIGEAMMRFPWAFARKWAWLTNGADDAVNAPDPRYIHVFSLTDAGLDPLARIEAVYQNTAVSDGPFDDWFIQFENLYVPQGMTQVWVVYSEHPASHSDLPAEVREWTILKMASIVAAAHDSLELSEVLDAMAEEQYGMAATISSQIGTRELLMYASRRA